MLLAKLTLSLAAAVALAIGCNRTEATRTTQSAGSVAAPSATATPAVRDSVTDLADRGRIRGSESAPIWFVIVSDFQCPFCKQWHDETFPAIERDYVETGKIRIAYLNFPLNMHKYAIPSAEAAMCASVQGKFWEMQDALFATQKEWSTATDPKPIFESSATELGLDVDAWRNCVTSHATLALIQADRERAASSGVQSTPSFFVGNEGIAGAEPLSTFRAAIERQLALAAGGTKPPAR